MPRGPGTQSRAGETAHGHVAARPEEPRWREPAVFWVLDCRPGLFQTESRQQCRNVIIGYELRHVAVGTRVISGLRAEHEDGDKSEVCMERGKVVVQVGSWLRWLAADVSEAIY